jgi:DNA-binding NarL/FixJ family response regulator
MATHASSHSCQPILNQRVKLAQLRGSRELQPDLILMDLAMPGPNGLAAASVVKDMIPKVRIVLFTMYSEAVSKASTSLKDVDAMVDKAEGMDKPADCVQDLLSPSP